MDPDPKGSGRVARLAHESPVAAARATGLPVWRMLQIYSRWQAGTYESAPVLAEVARRILEGEAGARHRGDGGITA